MKLILRLCCLVAFPMMGQESGFTGRVHAEEEPLSQVNIYISGSSQGTTTDKNGNFELYGLAPGEYQLVVSALGYRTLQKRIQLYPDQRLQLNLELQPSSEELEEVLLSSVETGLREKTPYNLSRINLRGLENQGHPNGILGVLRKQPGIYGAEMGQGIVKPFIRGLGFSRVVSLYQGNKLENHQWGADHGLGINDLGVKAVDVIKGPASVLYGSGALGGILISMDEDAFLKRVGWTGNVSSGYNTVSNGFRSTASIGKKFNGDWFAAANLAHEQHADYRNGNGRLVGNSRFQVNTLRLHTGIDRESFGNKLSFTYNRQDLGIISDDELHPGRSKVTSSTDFDMQLPYQKVRDYLLSYNQTTEGGTVDSYLHLSHHFNRREEIESHKGGIDLGLEQQHTFYNGRVKLSTGKLRHQLGLQGSFVQTENLPESLDILIPDAEVWENGLFYLVSYDVSSYFLQAAVRYDHRKGTAFADEPHFKAYGFLLPGEPADGQLTKEFSGFTGSLGVTKSITPHQKLKLNLSTGFRAPDLAELFSNGPHPGTSRFEMGNVHFNREQSYQLDLSYIFQNDRFKGSFSSYIMSLKDYIFFSDTGERRPEDDLVIWSYYQDDVVFYGLELDATYFWTSDSRLSTSLTASLVRAEKQKNKEPLNMIPPDNLGVEMTYKAFKNRSLVLTGHWQIVAEQDQPGPQEEPTKGYGLLQLGASKTFVLDERQYLEFSLTIENLLGQNYVDHMSLLRPFRIQSPGRNVRFGLKYAF